MLLQGTMQPAPDHLAARPRRPTLAMGDHDDHIHVGFAPLFGENRKLGQQAFRCSSPASGTT